MRITTKALYKRAGNNLNWLLYAPVLLYGAFYICMRITMANEIKNEQWKQLLKCKECWKFKEITNVFWYKHNEWFMWVLWRCKDCIKKWRTSDKELKMARVRDRDRYYNNVKRRNYVFTSSKERRKRKWYGKIHSDAQNIIKRKYWRPNKCSVCNNIVDWINILRIVFHHPDYTKPFEWVFCCDVCHSKIHSWKIECSDKIISIKMPF